MRLSGTASHGLFCSEFCQHTTATMASSGEDSYVGSTSDDNLLAQGDTTDIEVEVLEVEQRHSSRKRSRSQSPGRAVLPTNLRAITPMLNAISKRLHGHDIDANLSLRIVAAALELQKGYLEEMKKASKQKNKHVKRPQVRDKVCKFFRISAGTYSKIMGDYLQQRQVYVSGRESLGRAGNTKAKETRIPRTERLRIEVRNFVRTRRMSRSRVTARQVLEYFLEQKHLVVPLDAQGRFEKLHFQSAYRATQRWLSEFGGYKRGKRKNLVPSEQQVAKRHHYLREFFGNRAKPPAERWREVYTDQSYIHEHYHRNDDSVWDPNDEQDVQHSKDQYKGRRYCFAHAIQGANPRVEEPTLPTDMPGLVPGAMWAFCPQKKGDHQGDYHKVFNGENIVA